jgi:hypothetical protein
MPNGRLMKNSEHATRPEGARKKKAAKTRNLPKEDWR